MENAVNKNRQLKKVPVKLQHFFKHEKEEQYGTFPQSGNISVKRVTFP